MPAALLDRFRVSPRDLAALRKSAVLKLWLRKSWSAWVWGVVYSVFARWIFPMLATPVLRIFYPPVKGKGLDWLVSTVNNTRLENPRVGEILDTVAPLVWLFGFSLFMALLEVKIRPAIESAKDRSRTLENEAESKLAVSPTESVMLYRRAIDLAVEPGRESELRRKMADLDARLSRVSGDARTAPPPSSSPSRGSWKPADIPVPAIGATIVPDGGASKRIGVRGRYRLEQEIARGGMGVVWRGYDTVLERAVAVKEMPPTQDPGLKDRFRQEALALARLSHANVVQVYDFVEEDDERMYMTMELVEGGDLEGVMRKGKLPLSRALEIARQIALGLSAAHKRGIVHRDVKPLNVLMAEDGTPKVTDFGLAKLAEATMNTVEGSVLGSPRYMSPEQAAGKPADARSDVYSFGATLFHLIAGKPPFDGDTASVLAQHITQPPPSVSSINPSIPKELDALVASLLAKDPEKRPKGLDEIASRLATLR